MDADRIPRSWQAALAAETREPYFAALQRFVEEERRDHDVYPPPGEVFTALDLTPPGEVRVVILGQDPYHGPGQAHGLAFSVRPGVKRPPSLTNIFKELKSDLGCTMPGHGSLVTWAEQGVLLLNAVLTVRRGEPNSHRGKGWERFTDAVLRHLVAGDRKLAFLLWGAYAQRKAELIGSDRHVQLRAPHPSPLSASRGFFGSRPFSGANRALREAAQSPIDWCLPPEPPAT
jgi:uracil-DNA glycosylase